MSRMTKMPYIKTEPEEYPTAGQSYNDFDSTQNFGTYANQSHNSIDPSELSMNSGMFSQQYNFGGGGHNMSSSFNTGGNAGFGDDELMASLNTNDLPDMSTLGQPLNMNYGQMNSMYSNTPDGAPIQSPFVSGFDYSQFRPMHMSPHQNPSFVHKRPSMQMPGRKTSNGPLTPRTSAMANLQLGTPESSGMQQNGRAIKAPTSRHQKSGSGQFDGTPTSLHSYLDSPLLSPSSVLHHNSISEALAAGKHAASLPTTSKLETNSPTTAESQEAKKKRRRASHNAVERRRRDNINERIHDLSHLVPQHRLDDDRVRKQLMTSGPMSPSMAPVSMSPPNAATSILAGAQGRRAASTAGNITIGLPIDDKEKGPNKGDILNGSVAWTRDMMWALYHKYVQEDELAQYITSLGGQWPFAITEDEKRMRTELMDAVEKNDITSFSYSRTDGSGLRVPKHTTVAGDKLQHNGNTSLSPSSNLELSPGFHSGGSGTGSGSNHGQPQFWHSAGHAGMSFKEEDEFMDIN